MATNSFPLSNSQRFRVSFQSAGGLSASQRPVARLTGTLKMIVEIVRG